MRYGFTLVAAAAILIVGRNNTSPSVNSPGAPASGDNKFSFSVPKSEDIKQGEKKAVKIDLNRGKDFKEAVKFKVEAPAGLKASLSKETIAAGDPAEATVMVEVDKDAAVGEHVVKVTATPEKAAATTQEFKVDVKKP